MQATPRPDSASTTRVEPPAHDGRVRVVVLGGGFGGINAVRRLERLCAGRSDVEITLVSRDNFFVLSPLLFEACSGVLELRHCAQPIRPALRHARFVEGTVETVDVTRRIVEIQAANDVPLSLPYDQLILALGSTTNLALIPGSDTALTFKSVADALILRNHVIERLERADAASYHEHRRACLTFVIVGGGLVGTELLGELTAFADDVLRYYPRIRRDELRFHLLEASTRILPELSPGLAEAALHVLRSRGADIRVATPVCAIEPGRVRLATETLEAETIVLAAGIAPNPVIAGLPIERDERGRVMVDASMRSVSHPDVWALGDCAAIPAPDGHPYPALAQHAVREARQLARNVVAVVDGQPPAPFVFRSLGTMAALGHTRAVAQVLGVRVTGLPAWWLRRTYYLLQMPRWERRLRIILDWTVALFFRPDLTKVDLDREWEQERRTGPTGATRPPVGSAPPRRGMDALESIIAANAERTARASTTIRGVALAECDRPTMQIDETPTMRLRADATADSEMLRVVDDTAVKRNAFPSRPGYARTGVHWQTHLHVEAWVMNDGNQKQVWADVQVYAHDGTVATSRTCALAWGWAAGDGGDVFRLDEIVYEGTTATPGSVEPRPDVRLVRYRVYGQLANHVVTDGLVHECMLRSDIVSQ